jgi:hypothetical protein
MEGIGRLEANQRGNCLASTRMSDQKSKKKRRLRGNVLLALVMKDPPAWLWTQKRDSNLAWQVRYKKDGQMEYKLKQVANTEYLAL